MGSYVEITRIFTIKDLGEVPRAAFADHGRQRAQYRERICRICGREHARNCQGQNYGIVPSLKMLIKIADKLELSFLYLLGESDSNDFIPSANPSSFYKRLPQIAEERGENYGHIASRMPFPRTYIYEWLKENTLPSPEYLLALAEYFNVSPDYLLGRTDYRN